MPKPTSTPVRLTAAAIEWARIASGYTGESVAAYCSRAIEERGREDVARLHAQRMGWPKLPGRPVPGDAPPEARPKRKPKGKGEGKPEG